MTHVHFIEDARGDLVDIEYFCSRGCLLDAHPGDGPSGWPCPDWPDYSVSCVTCETVLHSPLMCPYCDEPVWDGPQGSKLAKCWNFHPETGGTLAFDTMED